MATTSSMTSDRCNRTVPDISNSIMLDVTAGVPDIRSVIVCGLLTVPTLDTMHTCTVTIECWRLQHEQLRLEACDISVRPASVGTSTAVSRATLIQTYVVISYQRHAGRPVPTTQATHTHGHAAIWMLFISTSRLLLSLVSEPCKPLSLLSTYSVSKNEPCCISKQRQ